MKIKQAPKIKQLKMYSKKDLNENVELLFIQDEKVILLQTVKMNFKCARDIVKKIENVLLNPGSDSVLQGTAYERIYLENFEGDKVELLLDTCDMNWYQINYGPYDGYLSNLIIDYPDSDENHFLITRQKKIFGRKENIICEFYLALKNIYPKLYSTLIESILENGDLKSFYERTVIEEIN